MMTSNGVLVFGSVLIVVSQIFTRSCVGGSVFDRPQIISEYEYILTANYNHTVFCQGNRLLTWTVPKAEEGYESWTTFEMIEEKPTNTKFEYGLRLYITNITYPFVGFYYCHYQDADKNSDTDSAKIYLFVNDTEHLSVLGDTEFLTIDVFQDQEAVIPCRPTSPDVTVKLFSDINEVKMDEIIEETGTSHHYDQHLGFITNNTHVTSNLLCQFVKGKKDKLTMAHLVVETPVTHMNPPSLVEESGGHAVVGEKLTLTCSVKTENRVFFNWTIPRKTMEGVTIETSESDSNCQQDLIIMNTTLKDNGMYVCKVWDRQNHTAEVKEIIKIFDVNENFIRISEPSGLNHTVAYVGEDFIQWIVDVEGHPQPIVAWLDNKMRSIAKGVGQKYEVDYDPKTHKARLRIKNIEIHDFGTYTVLASNNYRSKNWTLFLSVTDKPTVHLEVKPFSLLGTNEIVQCTAAAYPDPVFFWEYKRCLDDSCQYEEIIGNIPKSTGLVFTSEVHINATENGLVKCIASNINGSSEAVSGFFVSDVENGFDLFDFDSSVVLDKNKNSAIFAEGDTIAMTCGASTENYSNIEWLFNDTPVTNDARHSIEASETKFSRRKKLMIPNANSSDIGQYKCKVILNKEYVYKKIFVSVKAPVPPQIHDTNMQSNTIEMNFPDNLTLICRVHGIPKPTIIWEKDSVPFNPPEGRIQILDEKEVIHFTRTYPGDQGTYKCSAKNKMGATSAYTSLKFKSKFA